ALPIFAGCDVAFYLAQDHNFLGIDVGLDLAVAANRNAIAGQIDGAFYASVDIKRFRAGNFALDDERFPDRGLLGVVENGIARRRDRRWLARLSGGSAHNWFLRFRCGFLVRIRRRRSASRLPHYFSTSFRFDGNAQPATFSPAAMKSILAVGGTTK